MWVSLVTEVFVFFFLLRRRYVERRNRRNRSYACISEQKSEVDDDFVFREIMEQKRRPNTGNEKRRSMQKCEEKTDSIKEKKKLERRVMRHT